MALPDDMKAPILRDDGLQLAEATGFQRWTWRTQPLAWIAFLILIGAALAGLTGGGGHFARQNVDLDGVRIEMPAISRWADSDRAILRLVAPDRSTITFGPHFAEFFTMERITPAPLREVTSEAGITLQFQAPGEGEKMVTIALRATAPGLARFRIHVSGRSTTTTIIILP